MHVVKNTIGIAKFFPRTVRPFKNPQPGLCCRGLHPTSTKPSRLFVVYIQYVWIYLLCTAVVHETCSNPDFIFCAKINILFVQLRVDMSYESNGLTLLEAGASLRMKGVRASAHIIIV